jgi:nuclear protein localization family protein 4
MFRSTKFSIENRPGLENQRIEDVLSTLSQLGASDISVGHHSAGGDSHKRIELAKWLSDWHLLAFLGTTGLFSDVRTHVFKVVKQLIYCRKQNDMKVFMQTASSQNLLEDVTLLDPLLATDGWQSLVTFARELARA